MPGRHFSGGGSHYAKQRYNNNNMPRNGNGVDHNSNASIDYCDENINDNGNPNRRRDQHSSMGKGGMGGYRKQWGIESYLADDENYPSFQAQLTKLNLQLRDIPADGNCLFRALGDQLEGHCRNHFRHRSEVVHFMRGHRLDFEPFVEDDMCFDDHLLNLQRLGTHAGNDAIVAFAKLNASNVVIHQLNGKPLLIQGPQTSTNLTRQLHIAYHNGDHYSSVRRKGDNAESPAHIRLEDAFTGAAEGKKTSWKKGYNGVVSAKRDLGDIEYEVQMATRCEDMNRVRESLLECDYDVDAAIADLLQQMELTADNEADSGFQSPPASPQINGTNLNGKAGVREALVNGKADAGETVVNGEQTHLPGSSMKSNGQGKGHKVHFREDSFGSSSSGYGSMTSKDGGARPKMVNSNSSHKKTKEEKKLEKKRRAEEARRQKFLLAKHGNNNHLPHPEVRDVTVVSMDRKFTPI